MKRNNSKSVWVKTHLYAWHILRWLWQLFVVIISVGDANYTEGLFCFQWNRQPIEMTENICRLCYEKKTHPLAIFTEEGVELKIAEIIRKHFPDEVNICIWSRRRFGHPNWALISGSRKRRSVTEICLRTMLGQVGGFPRVLQGSWCGQKCVFQ